MTKDVKDWVKQISITLLGVICTLLIVAFTFNRDTKYTETKELKQKVIELDLKKVDKTDFENMVKANNESHDEINESINQNFKAQNEKIDQNFKEQAKLIIETLKK